MFRLTKTRRQYLNDYATRTKSYDGEIASYCGYCCGKDHAKGWWYVTEAICFSVVMMMMITTIVKASYLRWR